MRGDIMHIKRKKLRIILIILAVMVAMFIAVEYMMTYYTYVSWNGTWGRYEEGEFASNSSYYGMIDCDGDDNKVVIWERQSGKEVSSLDVSDDWPNQIALGESSYFLLYRWESEDGDARIVQYDYESQKMAEYISPNTAVIFSRDGYLFIGNWKVVYDEDDKDYYNELLYHGFYAHYYIAESQFGNQPEPLEPDSEGRCLLENETGETVELYQHEADYFSTEPMVEDYPGISIDFFDAEYWDDDYQADTQREAANRELLYSELGREDKVYSVAEHQTGDMIYGVCNVLNKLYIARQSIGLELEDVKETCFYSIDPKENQISILYRSKSCIGLAVSEQVAVYQDGNQIIQRNLQTGKQKTIYTINNRHNVQVFVQGDYLQIVEEKKHMLQMIYDLGRTEPVLVCWND